MTIDTATIALMQSIESPIITIISKFLAYVFDPLAVIILSFIIVGYIYVKHSKKQSIFFASVIVVTAAAIKLLKALFHRARPLTGLIQESGFSLPSGHVTMSVVFLGMLVYLFPKKRKIMMSVVIPLALLVAFSRLYLQIHWFTDVIVGFMVSGIILLGAIILHKKLRI